MKVLLTGKMGVGKSTILNNAIKKYNIEHGIFTRKIDDYVYAWFLNDENQRFIIGEKSIYGMKSVDKGFESLIKQMKNINKPDFFVIDEIGYIELSQQKYLEELKRIIDESQNFIGVIRLFFIDRYEFLKNLEIIEITEENRNNIII
ncbi:putative nucleotide kinase [Marinitoga piezophila KA3]|uniref:Putative nucleotide kinase n=1 Tax=Marinitoga piezophila (strain DSM 14283 / JCM 11233 / KA3) TaxID=443254 RepID=H2J5Z2_MARPK|nr:nucleoside-triphosphatase [Marinitoga piezophila]AEX86211.1 putative nucleotide kinase [Marinitoga piezophila KA3]